jgi:hypothetical protein
MGSIKSIRDSTVRACALLLGLPLRYGAVYCTVVNRSLHVAIELQVTSHLPAGDGLDGLSAPFFSSNLYCTYSEREGGLKAIYIYF